MSSSDAINLIEFLHVCENLKRTKRTGWIENSVVGPESISDHMHRMSLMAMLVEDDSVDKNRCVKMAVVHDLAEAIVGDISPQAGIPKADKHRMEKEAMEHMCKGILKNSKAAQEIYALWWEYEEATTKEALLVKDLDKFEMIVQALEYEQSESRVLECFYKSTEGKFQHPQVKLWVETLHAKRKALSTGAPWPPVNQA